MSVEVDNVSLDTKEEAVQKKLVDDVASCVDKQADEAVTLIYTKSLSLTDRVLKTIYDEEKEIIFCGRKDDACLTKLIADIKKKTSLVPDVVNEEIEVDRQAVDEQIAAIKACATKIH